LASVDGLTTIIEANMLDDLEQAELVRDQRDEFSGHGSRYVTLSHSRRNQTHCCVPSVGVVLGATAASLREFTTRESNRACDVHH